MTKVLKLTKEQLENTTNNQRELLYKRQLLIDAFESYASRISNKEMFYNKEVFESSSIEDKAYYSIITLLQMNIQAVNLEMLDDMMLEKGFDINADAYQKSNAIVQDEKLFFQDEKLVYPIESIYDDLIKTLSNAD